MQTCVYLHFHIKCKHSHSGRIVHRSRDGSYSHSSGWMSCDVVFQLNPTSSPLREELTLIGARVSRSRVMWQESRSRRCSGCSVVRFSAPQLITDCHLTKTIQWRCVLWHPKMRATIAVSYATRSEVTRRSFMWQWEVMAEINIHQVAPHTQTCRSSFSNRFFRKWYF